jgi:two-component system sensor histidine kinase KdpD
VKVHPEVQHYLVAVSLTAVVTLGAWLLRDLLTLANFTTIFLFLVLMIAIWRGTGPALTAALVSFLSINYFLVPPLYTFLIADPHELLDIVVYLVVAIFAGRMGANARQQTTNARQRADEQEILYRLTRDCNQVTTLQGVYDVLDRTLRDDFNARHTHYLPYAGEVYKQDHTVHYILLQADERVFATLVVAFEVPLLPQQVRLLTACATQAAQALYRIHLNEQAQKSQQFEDADRLKTALLRAVSHDLRTPITIIKSSANNLRRLIGTLSSAEQVEIATTIEQETDHLDRLIGNLLDMSRLQAGALQLNVELNSLEEVVGDVASTVWKRSQQERIRICFPDDMPLVRFDYGLILQAISNLVDNSLRFEPAESKIEICGQIDAVARQARVLIINHGANIAPAERERIMEPFYTGKGGGTGLGLPIARGIVEAHHGRLQVEDTLGGGATFILNLPLSLEAQHDVESAGR